MKHIKAPVDADWDEGRNIVRLGNGDGEYIAQRYGGAEWLCLFQEIATALNEIDILREQRDALVGACEAQQRAIVAMVTEWDRYEMLGALDARLYVEAQRKARAALALVRGEEEKQS